MERHFLCNSVAFTPSLLKRFRRVRPAYCWNIRSGQCSRSQCHRRVKSLQKYFYREQTHYKHLSSLTTFNVAGCLGQPLLIYSNWRRSILRQRLTIVPLYGQIRKKEANKNRNSSRRLKRNHIEQGEVRDYRSNALLKLIRKKHKTNASCVDYSSNIPLFCICVRKDWIIQLKKSQKHTSF